MVQWGLFLSQTVLAFFQPFLSTPFKCTKTGCFPIILQLDNFTYTRLPFHFLATFPYFKLEKTLFLIRFLN